EKSTPSKGKRSSQEIAIAPVHQFVALGNEAAGPILEESAGSAPVLGDAPLPKNRNRNLAVREAKKAAVECDQCLKEPFAQVRRHLARRDRSVGFGKALQDPQTFDLGPELIETKLEGNSRGT